MSNTLSPTDFNLPSLGIRRAKKGSKCCKCGDSVKIYRWSDQFCPDCDIRRMKRISDQFEKIIKKMEEK